jgi:hypothetical protein
MVIPIRCAVDRSGNLFVVDQGAHRVRKVDTSGGISTFAGNGSQGFSGDGGPAAQAAMNNRAGRDYHHLRIESGSCPGPGSDGAWSAVAVEGRRGWRDNGRHDGASLPRTQSQRPGATQRPGPLVTFGKELNRGEREHRGRHIASDGSRAGRAAGDLHTRRSVERRHPWRGWQHRGIIQPGVARRSPLTGLGPVSNTPASGAAASLTTLSNTVVQPKMTIGGFDAPVIFWGLTPGFIGLYQVNVTGPAAVASGTVDLTVQANGVTSNTAKIVIR